MSNSTPKNSRSNVQCAWCNKDMKRSRSIPEGQVIHGMCKPCQRDFLREMVLGEDNFQSSTSGGRQLHHNPKFTMTHLTTGKDSHMDDYVETDDESTVKTDNLKKDYAEKNHDIWGNALPITTHLGT